MVKTSEWLIGLQVYAYDVNDEGADAVVNAALQIGASVIFVAVSYLDHITTTKKGRAPTLQHNPHRQKHSIEAQLAMTLALMEMLRMSRSSKQLNPMASP